MARWLAYLTVPAAALAVAPYLIPPPRRRPVACAELATPHDRYVVVDGFRMRYQVAGSGPALILVHGFGSSAITWYRNMGDLACDHRVYAVDLKGWGLSDKPASGDYSLRAQARHLRSFMRAVGVERAVIVGHSMGGAVAVHMAAEFPEAVQGIVLIDAAGARRVPFLRLLSRAMALPPVRRWLSLIMEYALDNEYLLTRAMPQGYYDPSHLSADMKRALLQPLHTEGFVDALLNLTRDAHAGRLDGRTSLVQCPALIVWGEHDRAVPPRDGEHFQKQIRASRLVVLPEAGHLPHEERAGEVNRLIREFVADL